MKKNLPKIQQYSTSYLAKTTRGHNYNPVQTRKQIVIVVLLLIFSSRCREVVDTKLSAILQLVQPLSNKIEDTKDTNVGLQEQIR